MKKALILSILPLLFCLQLNAGGPWPTGKGNAYIKLSEWWTVFDQHFTDQGFKDPNLTTGLYNTSLYVEYGLGDRFTAIFNAPILSRNFMNNLVSATNFEVIVPGEAINTFGDIEIGGKYNLTKPGAKFPIAATLTLGIPTGVAVGGTQGNLQTGDGEFNQILQIDAGTGFSLGAASGYVSGYAGINNRSKGFSEEFRYGLEVGVGLINNRFYLSGKLNAVESFRNGDTAASVTSTSIFGNNSEFVTLGIEANVYITEKFGVSAGFTNVTSGEIFAAAPSYSVGVFLDIK